MSDINESSDGAQLFELLQANESWLRRCRENVSPLGGVCDGRDGDSHDTSTNDLWPRIQAQLAADREQRVHPTDAAIALPRQSHCPGVSSEVDQENNSVDANDDVDANDKVCYNVGKSDNVDESSATDAVLASDRSWLTSVTLRGRPAATDLMPRLRASMSQSATSDRRPSGRLSARHSARKSAGQSVRTSVSNDHETNADQHQRRARIVSFVVMGHIAAIALIGAWLQWSQEADQDSRERSYPVMAYRMW